MRRFGVYPKAKHNNLNRRLATPLLVLSMALGMTACESTPPVNTTVSELSEAGCDPTDENSYALLGVVSTVDHKSGLTPKYVYDAFDNDFDLAMVETHTYDMTVSDINDPNQSIRVIKYDDGGMVTAFPGKIKLNGSQDFQGIELEMVLKPTEHDGGCIFRAQ